MSRAQLTSTVEQNTGGAVAPFVAGKNKIINGDFGVWQRGTSGTRGTNTALYVADRFWAQGDGSPTITVSQQTFTSGTAPVAGYEGTYFYRFNQSVAGSGSSYNIALGQNIEDVRIFAGQTVTYSLWIKGAASGNITPVFSQNFGTGGSSAVYNYGLNSFPITTSWTKVSVTFSVPSIAGKTIGTGSSITMALYANQGITQTIDIWGVQLEAGSVATPFTTASGTLQGELALCQRYYFLTSSANGSYTHYGVGQAYSSSAAKFDVIFPVTMRVAPNAVTVTAGGSIGALNSGNTAINTGTISIDSPSVDRACCLITGSSGLTAGNATVIMSNASTATSLAFSAEL